MINTTCTTREDLVSFFKIAEQSLKKGPLTLVGSNKCLQFEEFELEPKRTAQQNKAMHKYFGLLSEALNDAGLDMRATLKPDAELPWTPESVKTYIWKVVQDAMFDKESTAKLDTKEVDQVYKAVSRHLSNTFNINVEFPNWVANR